MRYFSKIATVLIMFTLVVSCSVASKNGREESMARIVFATLSISGDSAHASSIKLVNTTIAEGQMKTQKQNSVRPQSYLSIYIYTDKVLSDSLIIEHPLYKHVEFADDAGNFAAKDIVLNKAEFFFRFQKTGNIHEIRIAETIKNRRSKELTIIKL